jgi:hypothetical protein
MGTASRWRRCAVGAYATAELTPDLTIYLDIDVVAGLARKRAGAVEEWNRMEEKALAFHERVRQRLPGAGAAAIVAGDGCRQSSASRKWSGWRRNYPPKQIFPMVATLRQRINQGAFTMKLVMAIINSDDTRNVLDRLARRGFSATVTSTTGGFLRVGNTTIFCGVDDMRSTRCWASSARAAPAGCSM